MCRLVAYLGTPILLDEVLVKPKNSLVLQSLQARESKYVPTNGDGFGIGWYAPNITATPAIFRSIFPAWNDANLLNITAHIQSSCFFGHVRAASVGGINSYNCHPFTYQSWMLMHNGEVGDFQGIHRYLRQLLDDDLYHWIKRETDSEHIFALFLQLARGRDLSQLSEVAAVLLQVYQTIDL